MRILDIAKTIESLTEFIQQTVHAAGFSDVVIAVSGGVDSATAVSLATRALGPDHVHAVLLPYKDWHEEAKAHARLVLQNLGIFDAHIHEVDIAPMVEAFITMNHEPQTMNKVRLGNVMARVRMTVLYDFAKKLQALVVGTENKSEHYLGYFTRFGDEASDLEPIRNLYKTEVFELAKALTVPDEILKKAPTAGLWQGQTDEGQFGFSYKEADQIIYALFEAHQPESLLEAEGISLSSIAAVKEWVDAADFKHHLPHIAPEPIIRI